jgi:SAM-dependent methyltransferase
MLNVDDFDPLKEVVKTIPLISVPIKSTLELEIRYSIDERKSEKIKARRLNPAESTRFAKNIINDHVKKNTLCSIEQSINFIKDDTNIKQMIFINGVQKKDLLKHYQKERVINPLIVTDSPSYKITLSFEHDIPEFTILECQAARIKLRFSIDMAPWRLDITLIRKVQTLTDPRTLKDDKKKVLYELSVKDFTEKAPWDYIHHIEYEAEYVGNYNNLHILDFKTMATTMKKYMDALSSVQMVAYNNFENNNEFRNGDKINQSISNEYQTKIYEIAKYIQPKRSEKFKSRFGIKQLSNQVIEMDKNIFLTSVYPYITKYYITDKVDGNRAVIMINEHGAWTVTNQLHDLGSVNNIKSTYIFDSEEYMGEYYIFDIMVWENKSIVNKPFHERLKLFKQAIKIGSEVTNLTLKEKSFTLLTKNFQSEIRNAKLQKKPYETDGLVFTPNDGCYNTMQVFKYKPIDKLSVDFLVKKCPQKLLGIKPYIAHGKTLYILLCGVSKNVYNKLNMRLINHYSSLFPSINLYYLPDYFPIQFEPSDRRFAYLYWGDDDKLDNNIGEFTIDSNHKWKLLRIREDRRVELLRGNYFGNNYKVAEMTWLSYQNPLVIEDMNLLGGDVYFQESDSELHQASRYFNSFVKSQIINQFENTTNVLDLASGKGQDLFRYAANSIQNIVFLEIDKTALMELIARKHDFSKNRKGKGMRISIQQMDLNVSYKNNISKLDDSMLEIPNTGFDLIICNFAFHYFISTTTALTNVIKFINHYLKPGGRFIFTAFDGQSVVDLLKKHGGEWSSKIQDKFNIKKEYDNDLIQPIGQKIQVLLPFNKNKYYAEYIVNIAYIEKEFAKYGIVLETNRGFNEYIDEYKNINSRNYNSMDADDMLYTSLYHYYGFYKNKK